MPCKLTPEEARAIHKTTLIHNPDGTSGCYCCLKMYPSRAVTTFICTSSDTRVALCPLCKVDSVLPMETVAKLLGDDMNSRGIGYNHIIDEMHYYWFNVDKIVRSRCETAADGKEED